MVFKAERAEKAARVLFRSFNPGCTRAEVHRFGSRCRLPRSASVVGTVGLRDPTRPEVFKYCEQCSTHPLFDFLLVPFALQFQSGRFGDHPAGLSVGGPVGGQQVCGWIHTHPGYDTHPSSVDLHQQYQLQNLRFSSIGIIVAYHGEADRMASDSPHVGVFQLNGKGIRRIIKVWD